MTSWSFGAAGTLLVLRHEGGSGGAADALPPDEGAFLLESATDSDHARTRLVDVIVAVEGRGEELASWTLDELRDRVVSWVRAGRLVVWRARRAPPLFKPELELPRVDSLGPTSWIEIVLVDQENKPVPGERYVLDLGDGTMRRGTLDGSGFAREEDLKGSRCKVLFPDLDPQSWALR
jgi:hypothetical protein